jgi:tRNA-specific 2-thiouridylase
VVRIALACEKGRVRQATFDAEGCGATLAAGSACIELVEGASLLDAARIGALDVARALGGLSPGKLHAADLAADALHRALSSVWAGAEALAPVRPGRKLVALSGGVDSAVAAFLARDAGQEVVAVTLQLWADAQTDGSKSCCSPQAVVTARGLAHSMGMPHLTLDLRERFGRSVVGEYLSDHDRGRTPNPCIRCNGTVRFDAMLELAERIGAESLVTGHYARIERDAEGPLLAAAADPAKDQTYMLSALSPELLERVRFPLAELTKPQVRQIARQAGLPVAEKKESQDLCFMAGTSRARFLSRHSRVRDREGEVVDRGGHVIGRHRGHRHYTVGQRRGLGVASSRPLYVLAKDAASNRVVVGTMEELATDRVAVERATLHRDATRVDRVKLRYRSAPVACEIAGRPAAGEHDSLTLNLREPAHGVAPGQTATFMEGERVLGQGTISSAG